MPLNQKKSFKYEHSIHEHAIHHEQVKQNQKKFDAFLSSNNCELAYVTAQDSFLSEYTALPDNLRYVLSGFSGSTGEGLFLSDKLKTSLALKSSFILFVDGRYHIQADKETSPELVEVVKLNTNETIYGSIFNWLTEKIINNNIVTAISIDTARTSFSFLEHLKKISAQTCLTFREFHDQEIAKSLKIAGWHTDRPIFSVSNSLTGRSIQSNLNSIKNFIKNHDATYTPSTSIFVTSASDDAAWILNARGYHTPNSSALLAYTFLIDKTLIVYLPKESSECEFNLDTSALGDYTISVIRNDLKKLKASIQNYKVHSLYFHGAVTNTFLSSFLKEIHPNMTVFSKYNAVESLRVAKTPEELENFKKSFFKSSLAIAQTMRWAKNSIKDAPSELDLAQKISDCYYEQGALELSFTTIAAAAGNSAIPHYKNPSAKNILAPGELVLLDSGAYYESGLATDCTRVIFAGSQQNNEPAQWQKEIYSLTLKACIVGMTSIFHKNTVGKELDQKVRAVCKAKGYDYQHGTGHGIGILVHENGVRISSVSEYKFTENSVVSMEPGIYLPNKGGVRIENVVITRQHPTQPDHFCFENIVWVGYDWSLIDISYFTESELTYLKEYERKCLSMNTQVTECPLLR